MSCEINVNILNNEATVKLFNSDKIGSGSYGSVYFIHKNNISIQNKYVLQGCNFVIKIFCNQEDIINEEYFYKIYQRRNNGKIKSLPCCYGCGVTFDKNTNEKFYYIILEYIGCLTLKNVFNIMTNFKKELSSHASDINELVKILYSICLEYCDSLHKINLVGRDIKPENIIVSDNICSYLISILGREIMNKFIFENLFYVIPLEISIKEIINLYKTEKYENILRFVDVGLFGDIGVICSDNNYNKYSKYNKYFFSHFIDFEPFDGLFVSTVTYLSPFSIFNLSSLINSYGFTSKKEYINILIKFLKLSDYWIINVLFAFYFCDIFNNINGNYIENLKNEESCIKKYCKNKNNKTYKFIDCVIFDINENANDKNKNIYIKKFILDRLQKDNLEICEFITNFFYNIIDIICYINRFSSNENDYFPFELDFSKKEITEIKKIMDDFFRNTAYDNMPQIFKNYKKL